MLSMLWTVILMCFFINWEIGVTGMVILLVMSGSYLNHMFVMAENIMFLNESVSNLMMFLSIMLCMLALLCTPVFKEKHYVFLIQWLMMVLMIAFSSSNILVFYIFFEISLIPTLMLIIGWGYQPERLQAGTYMMLYTVTASLPLLVFLLLMSLKVGSFDMFLLQESKFKVNEVWLFLFMVAAFLVKLPMYFFHLWLPKAHVEAPLAGSMILAGVLLKLGGYGLYLMMNLFEVFINSFYMVYLGSFSLFGSLLAAVMCLRQNDIKSYVAYSSVAHMGMVIVGILFNTSWSILSVKLTMFAHGFTSSALFFMAYVTYCKTSSRSLMYSSGLIQLFPLMSILWFLMLSVNMAAPPSINLLGELAIMPTLWMLSISMIIVMGGLMMLSATYNMYLYSSINHGMSNKLVLPSEQLKASEYLGFVTHVLPLFIIFKTQLFSV